MYVAGLLTLQALTCDGSQGLRRVAGDMEDYSRHTGGRERVNFQLAHEGERHGFIKMNRLLLMAVLSGESESGSIQMARSSKR